MNFAFPGASWFLLLLPAVILLYFLRLRRREVLVSSTLLWSKVLEDRRVNSPFQRFRNNLLLLLQLLVLLLLIGALSQPERETVEVEGRTHILIFDVSASMAVEEEDGESRLSLALKQAQEYLAGIGTQERAVLIRFAQQAQAVTPVTGDHNLLLKALQGLKVRPAATRLHDAMELALSIAKNKDDVIAVIFSDGAFAAWDGEEIPLPVEFMRVGKNASNSGIVALSSRLDLTGPGRSQVFVEVKNFSEEEATGMLSILQQGELVRAAQSERIDVGHHDIDLEVAVPEAEVRVHANTQRRALDRDVEVVLQVLIDTHDDRELVRWKDCQPDARAGSNIREIGKILLQGDDVARPLDTGQANQAAAQRNKPSQQKESCGRSHCVLPLEQELRPCV